MLLIYYHETSFSSNHERFRVSQSCGLNYVVVLSSLHHNDSIQSLLGTGLSPQCACFQEKRGSVVESRMQNSFMYLSFSLHCYFGLQSNFNFLIFQHLCNFCLIFIKIHIQLLLYAVGFFCLNRQVCSQWCLIICSQLHISFGLSRSIFV